MKKLILLLGTVLLSLAMYAQPAVLGQVYSFAMDSTVDTGDKAFTTGIIRVNGCLTIQYLATQASGTTAGTAYVQESTDGTSWTTMTTSNSSIQAVTNDTLTVVSAAVEIWNIPVTYGYKYRLFIDGSGSNHTYHYVKMVLKANDVPQLPTAAPIAWTQQGVTNTETVYFTTNRITRKGILCLQLLMTQVSGTAAGTAYVQESLDGTSWKTLNQSSNTIQGMSSVAAAMHATTAVATLTASAVSVWHIPVTYAAFYRIVVASTGTHHSHMDASRLLK
jgi:hypothetical protein